MVCYVMVVIVRALSAKGTVLVFCALGNVFYTYTIVLNSLICTKTVAS